MEKLLSDFLLTQIDLFSMDGVNTPSKEDQGARFFLERIAEELIAGREAFTDKNFALFEMALRNEPEIAEGEIDRVLTCRALESVSEMRKRLILLSKLDAVQIPSDQTAVYIREATRTYSHGLFQASAAMSRAALEQSVNECIVGVPKTSLPDRIVQVAKERHMDSAVVDMAKNAVRECNKVMHQSPAKPPKVLDILIQVRGFLQSLYSSTRAQ